MPHAIPTIKMKDIPPDTPVLFGPSKYLVAVEPDNPLWKEPFYGLTMKGQRGFLQYFSFPWEETPDNDGVAGAEVTDIVAAYIDGVEHVVEHSRHHLAQAKFNLAYRLAGDGSLDYPQNSPADKLHPANKFK